MDHVFVNHDTNLLDVTLAPLATIKATAVSPDDAISPKQARAALTSHGLRAPPTETLHTTTEHPFLTADRGFVNAQDLHLGEPVQRLDGSVGVVVAVTVTPGAAVRYNLTVHELHTYAVGDGLWVVHNCPDPLYRGDSRSPDTIFDEGFKPKGNDMSIENHLRGGRGSGYVAASTSKEAAGEYAEGWEGYLYKVHDPEGRAIRVDYSDPTYDFNKPYAWEGEVLFPGGIPNTDIEGAWQALGEENFGPFIPNPNYLPRNG